MKLKVDQIRTYDEAGFRQRAACLCFKSECESEVLLVSSSRCHDLWVVPGGGLEPGEKPETTAVREVHEEAGVIGRLERLLDMFENTERNTRTFVYILIVEKMLDDYDDAGKIGRLRRWFSLDEAIKQLSQHKPVQQEYLDKLFNDETHLTRRSHCHQNSASAKPEQSFSALNINRKCSKCCQAFHHAKELQISQERCLDKNVTFNRENNSLLSNSQKYGIDNSDKSCHNMRLLIEQSNSNISS